MTAPAVAPQIEGLPPGAVVRPIPQADGAPIEGLPPGAILKPLQSGYQGSMTSTGIAAPQGTSTAGEAWKAIKSAASDLSTGAAQGAANTVGSSIVGTAKLLKMIPGLGQYIPQQGIDALAAQTANRSKPENMTQSIGKGAEQAGEFMLPGAGEEEAAAHVAPLLSKLGRFASPLARIGYQAGTTGLINAAQGGSPTTGAIAGAAGGVLGEGLRAAAPAVAESALGIKKQMRGYGKTPGVAALEETSGLLPATIEQQAQQKLKTLTSGIQSAAASHPGPVSIQPAVDTIDQEITKAASENNAQAMEQLGRVKDAITKDAVTGQPIPADQSATAALNLKRGLRKQFVKNWNPELMSDTRAVAAHASGAIDNQLDTALGPEFQSANQRISSLIPVADRAESLGRDPGVAQNIGSRFAAHTGALTASGIGTAEGYRERGLPGAIGGGLLGLILPEALASTPAQMIAARTMYRPGALLRLLAGSGLQFNRPSQENP